MLLHHLNLSAEFTKEDFCIICIVTMLSQVPRNQVTHLLWRQGFIN